MGIDNTHPFQIHFGKDRYHEIEDMLGWCENHFGEGGYIYSANDTERWALVIAFGNSNWLFKNPEDAIMFALRWGL